MMKTTLLAFCLLCLSFVSPAQDTTIYSAVDVMPQFPGGYGAYEKYEAANLRYPEAEKAACKEGLVTVSFVVEKDGSISGAKVVREVPGSPDFSTEAVRLVSAMPAWTPGKKSGGKPVRVRNTMYVRFDIKSETPRGQAACGAYVPEDSLGYIFSSYKTFRPSFPGGDSVMFVLLGERMKTSPCYSLDRPGRLFVQFIVDTSGAVCNVAIVRPVGDNPGMHFAAASAVCGMPRWTPAVYKGKKANTKMTIDVHYGPGTGYPGATPHFGLELKDGQPRDPEEVANDVFTFAERMPEFPGNGFNKFLQDSLRYPIAEKEAGVQGTVYVSFVIEKDGSVTNVQVVKAVPNAPGLSAEAVRVVSSMPPWKPGMMNGKPVRVSITQPVKFVIK